ncbi:hypothetical protein PMAYCL1PPCAC_30263, partial [Pristionchus mayeri]
MHSFPTLKFSNGVEMPVIGLGTWQSSGDEVRHAVEVAITEENYPLIDTAEIYGNEEIIGDALHKIFTDGKKTRDDVFITTKLWPNNLHPDRSQRAALECLARLRLARVDLLLAHFPIVNDADGNEHGASVTVEDVWRGLESIYDKGLARAIGVSNFSVQQIERIMKIARVPIHNAQNELHLYFPQHDLAEMCKKHRIILTSYGSLGSPGRSNFTLPTGEKWDWADAPSALDDPTVKKLAAKYGKTPAQVLLRYVIERGIAVIPKSISSARIHENIDVFSFELSKEEVGALETAKHRQRLFLFPFMEGHPEDPFKADR